jgi:predicted O-linked N-acetylglucosamine transferase (SPINDLY family)
LNINNLLEQGILFHKKNSLNEAKKIYKEIIEIEKENFQAIHLLGVVFCQQKDYNEGIRLIEKSLQINNKNYSALNNLGNIFLELKKYPEAIEKYKRALHLNENYTAAIYNLGNAYKAISKYRIALEYYYKAIISDPKFFDAYYDYAELLERTGRIEEALKYYSKLLELNPNHPYLLGSIVRSKLNICEWNSLESDIKEIKNNLFNTKTINPFDILLITDSLKHQIEVIKQYSEDKFPATENIADIKEDDNDNNKIKIGYYSSDFSNHPVGYSIVQLFEFHNKEKFEVYAFYFGKKYDEITERISKECKKFIDVSNISDFELINLSKKIGINIAINLNGFTNNSRTKIFSGRLSPIQINALGYPSTMMAPYMDYIIADEIVIPEKNQKFFKEKIIYLPFFYHISDDKKKISSKNYTYKDFNLTSDTFIFCCFNNILKINPYIFSLWMKILKKNENSVLWLKSNKKNVVKNIKLEAEKFKINSDRIIFADKLESSADYLASYKLADLFLDTFPYNAHVTGCDALYSGLPILTLCGESFASRVGASLLNTLNMNELITYSETEYVSKAYNLSVNKRKITELKQELLKPLNILKLFNSKLYVEKVETAYIEIFETLKNKITPKNIYIK